MQMATMQWASRITTGLVACGLLVAGVDAQGRQETIVLPQPLPPQVERIELVWSDNPEPAVTVNPVEPSLIHAERLTGPVALLIPHKEQLRPFGSCQVSWQQQTDGIVVRFEGNSKGACGVLWFFHKPEQAVDVVSFHSLHVTGMASSTIELGMADQFWWEREDHVPVLTVVGIFQVAVPLAQLAGRVNVGALVALTLTVTKLPAELRIDRAWLEAHPPPRSVTFRRGLWVWNLHKAFDQAARVAETCRSVGCRRLAVQMPAPAAPDAAWRAFGVLVRRWRNEGFEVYALDGDPNAIKQPGLLFSTIERLLAEIDDAVPIGLQLDIEPYLLGEVRADPSWYREYLALLVQVRRRLPARSPLSVVVPFWFTSILVEGRPLAQLVFDVADEVVVMNYRSEIADARVLIEDWGRYGLLFGKPVWGAIETRPLPDERHLILRRVDRWEEATAFLDRATAQLVLAKPSPSHRHVLYLRTVTEYVVHGERLSYAGRSKETVTKALAQWEAEAASLGLAGLMIHDWEGYERLAPASPCSSMPAVVADE